MPKSDETMYNTFMLVQPNGCEILRITEDGEFFVKGKKVAEDKEIVDAFREFLISTGHLK